MKRSTIFFINLLLLQGIRCAGSHSIWILATLTIGHTPFPEFIAVVMLDDIQLFYYDSDVRKLIYKHHRSEHEQAEQEDAKLIFGDQYRSMKDRASFSKHLLNHTQGVHVQQRMVGCELLDHHTPGPLRSWDAFNTVNHEELHFSMEHSSLHSKGLWPTMWSHIERDTVEWLFANVYTPACIRFLKKYLNIMKNDVMKKVKPRVRLLQKRLPDTGGVRVTCLATGFYPRHINLTLLRDGQPVPDHQITGGELLPNGDETYQMRKSLEVSREELQQHHYTCTAQHLSLDNKLDIHLDIDPGGQHVPTVPLVLSLGVALLLLCVTGAIIAYRKCSTRHTGIGQQQTQQVQLLTLPT
ncbi:major histocompatibility complex class I-related gene protein-like [Engraulis encrasicolus]|uniref:major histocompatibility complex class I-related gene protein-like n=1 Tax=Engraulis encrasicolus TaxID=184585 RepID=UPI002FD61801